MYKTFVLPLGLDLFTGWSYCHGTKLSFTDKAVPPEGVLQAQLEYTIAFTLVPLSQQECGWKLFKDQAVVWVFQMRSVKIDKCKPRGSCPTEHDQITSLSILQGCR